MQQNCMCRLMCGQYRVHNIVVIFAYFRLFNATFTLIYTQYSVFFYIYHTNNQCLIDQQAVMWDICDI